MIATVVLLYKDGTTAEFGSDGTWKSAASPAEGWEKKEFDDAGWKNAVVWVQAKGPEEHPVLQPWIPDSVKVLWKSFDAGNRSSQHGCMRRRWGRMSFI